MLTFHHEKTKLYHSIELLYQLNQNLYRLKTTTLIEISYKNTII